MLWGAKESFTGWVSGWAILPSQTDPRLCVTAVWALLLSPQPLQTLTAQQLSLLCTIFSCQTVRPPFWWHDPALWPLSASRHTGAFHSQGLAHAAPFFPAPQAALPLGPSDSSQQPALPSSSCRLWFKFWGWVLGSASELLQGRAVGQWRVQGEGAALGSDKPNGDTKVPSVASPHQGSASNSCSDSYSKRQKCSVSKSRHFCRKG